MSDTGHNIKKYMISFTVGIVGGGILVAWAAKIMPKMMSGMMQSMMTRMQEKGFDPAEM